MFLNIVITIVGAALVLFGANSLTDGSVALARRFGITELVIGLTVVAMGTSLPEFIVSFMASIGGSAAMGIGNVVGSNAFNTLMIVGVTATVAPIAVGRATVAKDIPFSLLASVVLAALALDTLLTPGSEADMLSRGDGIALLGFFAVFMAYTFAIARSGNADAPQPNAAATHAATPTAADGEAAAAPATAAAAMPLWRVVIYIVAGLAGLIAGGELFVRGASGLARGFGVSEAVIGLTLVAGGTSLPELATSVVAARKGQSALAIGNVIGSNLFNIFWILGLCSVVTPMPVAGITATDMAVLIGSGIVFWLFARTKHTIVRWEGAVMAAAYVAYVASLIA
ncbi:MAG: calcium/sodium antiporter [Bacteroidaceae bacterium]|nr:calcium/sodium antiporter [Bacteroidaceae bacterium]